MDIKTKAMFAYPVMYKDEMTKEELCVPSPFITGLRANTTQKIIITAGYSVNFADNVYLVVDAYKSGANHGPTPIQENGKANNLKVGVFHNQMGIFLTSFELNDFEVKGTGFYTVDFQLFKADDSGKKLTIFWIALPLSFTFKP